MSLEAIESEPMRDEKQDLVKEARELLAKATPWPWTTTPGVFWICDAGHTGCGVWSTAYPPEGEPFPFAEQEADAALLARAPELLSSMADEIERLRNVITAEISNQCAHCKNGLAMAGNGHAHYGNEHRGVMSMVRCASSPLLRAALTPKGSQK